MSKYKVFTTTNMVLGGKQVPNDTKIGDINAVDDVPVRQLIDAVNSGHAKLVETAAPVVKPEPAASPIIVEDAKPKAPAKKAAKKKAAKKTR